MNSNVEACCVGHTYRRQHFYFQCTF